MSHGWLTHRTITPPKTPPAPEVAGLLASFLRHLKAANRSPATLLSYEGAVSACWAYLAAQRMPLPVADVRREHLETFLIDQQARLRATTARTRFAALHRFFAWLVEEGELTHSPMERMVRPSVEVKPPPVLTPAQIAAMLKVCNGRSFKDRRDQAVLRLLLDTGMRRAEIAGLTVDDVDLDAQIATVRGKGNRYRHCPFGSKTAVALDRYLRMRASHRHAARPSFWVSRFGALSSAGVYRIVYERAAEAGIPKKLHPHLFRHTFAAQYRKDGGQEGELMRLGGWRSIQVMRRYGEAEEDRRAIEAYRSRPSPGDRF